jgi:hypothetical protein
MLAATCTVDGIIQLVDHNGDDRGEDDVENADATVDSAVRTPVAVTVITTNELRADDDVVVDGCRCR